MQDTPVFVEPIENTEQGIYEIITPEMAGHWRMIKAYRSCEKVAGIIPVIGETAAGFFASMRESHEMAYATIDSKR